MEKEQARPTRILRASSFRVPESPVNVKKPISRVRSVRKVKDCKAEKTTELNKKDLLTIEKENKEMEDIEKLFQEKISLKSMSKRYFYQSSDKSKLVSSKKTLANLGSNRLNKEEATKLISKLPELVCMKEIEDRITEIRSTIFPRIMIHLRKHCHILMHGYGSKMRLLQSFVNDYLCEENCIVVPGFQSSITINQLLNSIIDNYHINIKPDNKSLLSLTNVICHFFNNQQSNNNNECLYLVIHNIDGPVIRNSLDIITILAQCNNIHIIATIDHIYADRLWSAVNSPSWLWFDCTTCLPYKMETLVGNSRRMADTSATGLDSLRAVMSSLQYNTKRVFLLLANYQMDNKSSTYEGMLIDYLLRDCRNSFLVTNEVALRHVLTEFKDHKLIQFKIGNDRSEYVKITLDDHSLQFFIDHFGDF